MEVARSESQKFLKNSRETDSFDCREKKYASLKPKQMAKRQMRVQQNLQSQISNLFGTYFEADVEFSYAVITERTCLCLRKP